MTKADLVEIVCERVNCPKSEAEAAVDEVFEEKRIKPKKADVQLVFIGLAFVPSAR